MKVPAQAAKTGKCTIAECECKITNQNCTLWDTNYKQTSLNGIIHLRLTGGLSNNMRHISIPERILYRKSGYITAILLLPITRQLRTLPCLL